MGIAKRSVVARGSGGRKDEEVEDVIFRVWNTLEDIVMVAMSLYIIIDLLYKTKSELTFKT